MKNPEINTQTWEIHLLSSTIYPAMRFMGIRLHFKRFKRMIAFIKPNNKRGECKMSFAPVPAEVKCNCEREVIHERIPLQPKRFSVTDQLLWHALACTRHLTKSMLIKSNNRKLNGKHTPKHGERRGFKRT